MKYGTDWQNMSAKDGTTGNKVKNALYFSWSQGGQAEEVLKENWVEEIIQWI